MPDTSIWRLGTLARHLRKIDDSVICKTGSKLNFPFSGGMNPFDIMQQASQLKTKMSEMKTTLQKIELTETAAEGKITVVSTGDGTIKSIVIDPEYYSVVDATTIANELQTVLNRLLTRAKQESLKHLKEAAGPFASMLGNLGVDL